VQVCASVCVCVKIRAGVSRCFSEYPDSVYGPVAGSRHDGKEPSGSLKVLNELINCFNLWSFGIIRRRVVIIYRRLGTSCRSHLHGSRFLDRIHLGIVTHEDGTDTLSRNVGK
jgi:hypothetical protein